MAIKQNSSIIRAIPVARGFDTIGKKKKKKKGL